MKKTILIILPLLTLFCCGTANLSIKNTVKRNISDTLSLGLKEYRSGNLNSAKSYYISALMESYSIDNTPFIIDISQKLSELSLRLSNYNDASNYIFTANNLKEHDNSKEYDFIIFLTMGKYYEKAYENPAGYETALKYYRMAAASAIKAADSASAFNNIGIVEKKLNRLDEAAQWFEKSLQINKGEAIYDALGDNYYYLGEVYLEKLDYQSALTNFMSALQNDKIAEKQYSIMDDLKIIAGVYLKLGRSMDSAYYYQKALNAALSMDDSADAAWISNVMKSAFGTGNQ
jgi:tetratricopeptide (TPR) repeat protein